MNASTSRLLDPVFYGRKMQDLVSDPDLHGDLLLFAVAFVECFREANLTPEGRLRGFTHDDIARTAFGPSCDELHQLSLARRLTRAVGNDEPRYQPPGKPEGCCAPMIRREGECGRKVYEWVLLRDPSTGIGESRGYCTRHWSLDHRDEQQRLHKHWVEAGNPEPPPNTGGVLRRHFANMEAVYAWARQERGRGHGEEPRPAEPPALFLVE